MMPNGVPYPVGGVISDTDGSTALVGATVTLTNLRTTNSASTTTESDGSYAFNLSDTDTFPDGYSDGDDLLFIARKVISTLAEKFVTGTSQVSGDSLTKNLTVKLYIAKNVYPLSGLDVSDRQRQMFEPTSRAMRIIPVDDDGVTYELIGQRDTSTSWKLMLPDGTQFGSVDADGNLKITGEFGALQTFAR